MTDRENKLRSILLDLYTFLEKGHYDNDPAMDPFYEKIEEGLSLFTDDIPHFTIEDVEDKNEEKTN